jgi:hypothetical protein
MGEDGVTAHGFHHIRHCGGGVPRVRFGRRRSSMTRNEGTMDRIVRVTLGVALLLVALLGTVASPWSWILGVAGAAMLVTGALGFCGVYALFGVSTCRTSATEP